METPPFRIDFTGARALVKICRS